jgi:hypothetical protein
LRSACAKFAVALKRAAAVQRRARNGGRYSLLNVQP